MLQSIVSSNFILCLCIEGMLLIFLYKKETFPTIQHLKALLTLGLILCVLEWSVYSIPTDFISNFFIEYYVFVCAYAIILQAILFCGFSFICKTAPCDIKYPKLMVAVFHTFCCFFSIILVCNYNTALFISFNPDPLIRYNRGPLYYTWSITTYLFALFAIIVFIKAYYDKANYAYRKAILPGIIAIIIMCASCFIQTYYFQQLSSASSTLVIILIYFYFEILRAQISNDMITGLRNRQEFHFELTERMKEASQQNRLFVIMLDINRFKEVNDLYGHNEGDNALAQFSNILKLSCRNSDAKPYRYGGDEFIIIKNVPIDFPKMAATAVEQFIEKIDDSLKDFNKSHDLPYELSASIGFAEYDFIKEESIPELISRADKMLYEYKKLHHKKLTSVKK